MDKRYQVFVSSTYADLKEERQAVIQSLMEMDCIPAGMEMFPAFDEEQWLFIKRIIDDCDYYVIIVGGRYGSIDDDGISYTEKEYNYAIEKGLKVLAFIHGDPDKIESGKTEKDPEKSAKLLKFIEKLKTGRIVKFWTSTKELPGLVALSLLKTIKTYPAIGWVRGNAYNTSDLLLELNNIRKEYDKLKDGALPTSKELHNEIIEITDIAGMDENYQLTGFYQVDQSNLKMDWKQEYTWEQLFAILSPYLLSQPDDDGVKKVLTTHCLTHSTIKMRRLQINADDFNTIKIQFMANKLITNDGYIWELTEKGKQYMLNLKIIRKGH